MIQPGQLQVVISNSRKDQKQNAKSNPHDEISEGKFHFITPNALSLLISVSSRLPISYARL